MSVNDDALGPSSDSFWDVEGYKPTVKRMDDGAKLCTDLMQLIQDRADIEKHYAKSLKAWAKKWNEALDKGPEYGTTEAAWKGVLVEGDRLADIRINIKDQLLNDVQTQIKQWKAEHFRKGMMMGPCKEAKQMEDDFKKAQKQWAKKYHKVKETKKAYWSACKMEKTATNQENNARADSSLSPDQLKKAQDKADKCRKEVEGSRPKYERALEDLNQSNAKYMEDMSEVFQKSQTFEEDRLTFVKEMLFGVHKCLDVSHNVDIPDIYNQVHHTVSQADSHKDLKWWSQTHGVDMAMNWPQFEEFREEMHDITRKRATRGDEVAGSGITLKRINTDKYQNEFPEYSAELHSISRKEKKEKSHHVGGSDGITLTSVSSAKNVGPPSYNNVMTTNNTTTSSTSNASANSTPPGSGPSSAVPRQMSYDTGLNPFGGDSKAIDLDHQQTSSATKNSPQKVPSTTTANNKQAEAVAMPTIIATSASGVEANGQTQNPFGDDDVWDDFDNLESTEGTPVRAIYDYDGQEEDELSFKTGEVFVKLKDRDDQGWCTGRKDGRMGLYPDNYAETINQ